MQYNVHKLNSWRAMVKYAQTLRLERESYGKFIS
nr:MAG TPA: hypothetical protein [Caudoviricetes sp.]